MSSTVTRSIFKNTADFDRYSCWKCRHLLQDPVQLACGHRLCQPCADKLVASSGTESLGEIVLKCSAEDCNEDIVDEDGAYYFPDRFVQREILNLVVICPFSEEGCNWEGRFEEYRQHISTCDLMSSGCEHCGEKIRGDQIELHSRCCPNRPQECPLMVFGCSVSASSKDELQKHMEESISQHLDILAARVQSIEDRLDATDITSKASHTDAAKEKDLLSRRRDFVESDGAVALDQKHDSGVGLSLQSMPVTQNKTQSVALSQAALQPQMGDIHAMIELMLSEKISKVQKELERNFMVELKLKDEEIVQLKTVIDKMEKTMRSKNVESEDRDFRLSLIENSNHDGSMIWKIPQFNQRKADAQNGKYTSIFSLPFYSGRYGYKMCLRLYIMGDGIGKGTHLSLFFVVMRGEFDNILQWPFTHKVTFKLINQAGGRDIVDTFQPDPMSSSFKKPTSDMNVASGSPRFVSHTELERGGFIVDETIFVKCFINTASICHP